MERAGTGRRRLPVLHGPGVVLGAVFAVLLAAGVGVPLAAGRARPGGVGPAIDETDPVAAAALRRLEGLSVPELPPAAPASPMTSRATSPAAAPMADVRAPRPRPSVAVAPAPPPPIGEAAPASDSERAFARQFPAQASARQDPADPASSSWAVLIGINAYQGVRNTVTSYQDAAVLRDVLVEAGWRADHILLLGDEMATHDGIVQSLEWLARKTDGRSTVVVSFSGHVRQQRGDPDGDGEDVDEALWTHDDRYLWDSDFSRLLNAVEARRMWVTIQGCEAAGFDDAGVQRPGRVFTYSSREDQKSFEDPEAGFSVQGHYLIVEGLRGGWGDADSDARVSVQEAFAWSAPRASQRTAGRQTPVLVDGLGAPFHLRIGEAGGG
jgi:hypothetical protein